MAQSRIVNTDFWKDSYIVDLEPVEKLLFIYLFTNPRTSLAGIYEINNREISFDTGIDKEQVELILRKFSLAGKVYYEKNWIVLSNFIKHQRLNPSIIRGIEKAIEELPEWLQSHISLEQSGTSPQISIFNGSDGFPQDSLSPVTPQYKVIKSNIKKLKEKKSKETKPDKPAGDSGEFSKSQKRDYAISMNKEREQKARASDASSRGKSNPEQIERKWK